MAVHNDIAHGYRPDDAQSVRNLSIVQRWYATQVADFVTMLKAIPEGNGTVYDNTVILWTNELGDPARHMNNNLPFVLLGRRRRVEEGPLRQAQHGAGVQGLDGPAHAPADLARQPVRREHDGLRRPALSGRAAELPGLTDGDRARRRPSTARCGSTS